MTFGHRIGILAALVMGVNACSSVRYGPATQERVWPGYLGSDTRGSAAAEPMSADPRPVWRTRVSRGVVGVPAVAEDVVAVSQVDAQLALLERATGDVIWRRHVGGPPAAGPLLRDDRLFVATQGRNGELAAYRLVNGRKLWSTRVGDIATSPTLHGDALYGATVDGWVACLDAATGRIRWRVRVANGVRAAPVAVGGHIVVATTGDSIFALVAATGRVARRRATPGTVLAAPALAGGYLVIGTTSGRVAGLDTADFGTAWSRDLGSAVVGAVALRQDTAWALTDRGVLWHIPVGAPAGADSSGLGIVARAGPMPVPGGVYVAGVDGTLELVGGDGTRRWSAQVRSPIVEPPLQVGTMLFVVSQRGEVVAFR